MGKIIFIALASSILVIPIGISVESIKFMNIVPTISSGKVLSFTEMAEIIGGVDPCCGNSGSTHILKTGGDDPSGSCNAGQNCQNVGECGDGNWVWNVTTSDCSGSNGEGIRCYTISNPQYYTINCTCGPIGAEQKTCFKSYTGQGQTTIAQMVLCS